MDTVEKNEPGTTFASDLRATFESLRERFWLIVLCAIAAGGLGYLYAERSPRIYASQLTVQVENAEQKILKIDGVMTDDLKALEVLSTIEANLTSPELLLRVIEPIGSEVIVIGNFEGTVAFDGVMLNSAGLRDIFVAG